MSFLPALKEKEASKLLATLDPLHYRVLSWSLEAIETILTGSYDESSLNLFVVNLCIRAVFPTQYFPTMITFFSALEPIYNDEHRMTTSVISLSYLGKCKQTLVTNWVVTQFFSWCWWKGCKGTGEKEVAMAGEWTWVKASEMFTSQARIDSKTGPDNLGRFEYLQALVTEFQDTDKQGRAFSSDLELQICT